MNKIIPYILAACCLFMVASCDTVFDVHPYDVQIDGDRNLNVTNIQKIEAAVKSKDTIRFAMISDSHQWLDDLKSEVNDINRRSDSLDFVIHCGDLTDFGATREFQWTRDHLQKLKIPFVALLGNHDCLGTGNQSYQKIFGNPDFSFIAGKVKFVCLNTNAIEFDYSRPVPNFDFMEEQVKADADDFSRTIVCMHAAPYSEQFNNNVAKVFNSYTHLFPGLMCCLYGHGHHTEQNDIYGDGIIYYQVANAAKHQYYIFTITPKGYRYEIIEFKHIFILGALLAAGSVQVHAADEVTGKSEELELTDSIVHDTLVLADGKLTRYDRRVMRYRKHWDLLIPTSGIIQTCGNMGIISLGIGWEYGKRRQWETQLLFGYIPKFSSDDEKLTMTLKENFIPWRRNIGKGWWFEPLECSLYFNTVFGHDFWTKQPTKYESGYYPFSTRVRPNIALGERFKYDIPHNKRKRIKSITFFYELGTTDIYFMRFYRNGNAGFWDVFGLSIGAKVQYL